MDANADNKVDEYPIARRAPLKDCTGGDFNLSEPNTSLCSTDQRDRLRMAALITKQLHLLHSQSLSSPGTTHDIGNSMYIESMKDQRTSSQEPSPVAKHYHLHTARSFQECFGCPE